MVRKNRRKWFPRARKQLFINSNMLFLLRLASSSFSDGFHWEEKPLNKRKRFPLAGMKDFVEKYFSAGRQKKPPVEISGKWRKNGFH